MYLFTNVKSQVKRIYTEYKKLFKTILLNNTTFMYSVCWGFRLHSNRKKLGKCEEEDTLMTAANTLSQIVKIKPTIIFPEPYPSS